MKTILLDNHLPYKYKRYFPAGVLVRTAQWMGLDELSNGALLQAGAGLSFDGLVTLDADMPFEQNLGDLPLALIVVRPASQTADEIGKVISTDVARLLKGDLEKKLYLCGKPLSPQKAARLAEKLARERSLET